MTTAHFKKALVALMLSAASLPVAAETYVAVDKPAKVFDEPNARGYVTLNTKNQEVAPLPGMVFKSIENSNGWHQVEYSPGLRGYISGQSVASKTLAPGAGNYKIANMPGATLNAEKSGETWKATVNSKSYSGKETGGIVVFLGADGNPAFSLVDYGEGPVAMAYDNSVTNFF